MRMVDLGGLAGGLVAGGGYLALAARDGGARTGAGVAALGAAAGLTLGWTLTRHFARDLPEPSVATSAWVLPTVGVSGDRIELVLAGAL